MLSTLKTLPLRDKYEVQQTTAAVASSTAVMEELNPESLRLASEILQEASARLGPAAAAAARGGQEDVGGIAGTALRGVGSVLAGLARGGRRGLERESWRSITRRAEDTIQRLINADLQQRVAEEAPVSKRTANLHALGARYTLSSPAPRLAAPAAHFSLPPDLRELFPQADCVQAHMVTYRHNPYLYGDDPQQIQTHVASLSLLTCAGEEVSVANLSRGNHVAMEMPHAAVAPGNDSVHTLRKENMNIHRFNLSAEQTALTLHVAMEMEEERGGRLFPVSLLIRRGRLPTPTQHDQQYDFPRGQDVISLALQPHLLTEPGEYYLGVVDSGWDSARPRAGEVRMRRYRLKLWWARCFFWHERQDRWDGRGCRLQPAATYATARCSCDHLTSFGAQFSLAPNTLDVATIADFFDLNENPVTFSLLAALLLLYLLLLVGAVLLDRHDQRKGGPVELFDNHRHDRQKYVIVVETGFRRQAGTSAKVSLVLHGEEGMSDTRELFSRSGQPLFERNSRDTFVMTLPESLGRIFKLQVWHNNEGASPGWFLSRVLVRDVNAGQTYYFLCEKWLAVEAVDGKVEREIVAVERGVGFTGVLWAKGTQYFADYHLWLSVATRPACSRFTRAQRLTCCLSLLMSYMAASAAWYRGYEAEEYRGEFGLVDLSWRSVVVGMIISVLVLPVNLLIVLMFRRSKIKDDSDPTTISAETEGLKGTGAPMLDNEEDALATEPASMFDQSMLNWGTLQEWAKKTWAKRYHQSPAASVENVKPITVQRVEEIKTEQPAEQLRVEGGEENSLGHMQNHVDRVETQNAHNRQRSSIEVLESEDIDEVIECDEPVSHERITPKLSNDSVASSKSTKSDISNDIAKSHVSVDSSLPSSDSIGTCSLKATGSVNSSEQSYRMDIRAHKRDRCFCPFGCQHFAWVLCFLVIGGCASVTVLYGFRFGRIKSIMWLQSLLFSLLQCVFLTHPILITLVLVAVAARYRDSLAIFDHHVDGVSGRGGGGRRRRATLERLRRRADRAEDEDDDYDLQEGIAQRQRSRYLRYLARPPQEKHLTESRHQTIKERKALAAMSEGATVLLSLFLMTFMAFAKDTGAIFRLGSALQTTFVERGETPFSALHTVPGWWQWTHDQLLPTLYYDDHYAGAETGFIQNTMLIGEVKLYQQREVRGHTCNLPSHYHNGPLCSIIKDYKPVTKPVTTTPVTTDSNATLDNHDHHGPSFGIWGRHSTYYGDQYAVYLHQSQKEAAKQLRELEEDGWIDRNTRAVVIEMTLFHAPTNLFSSVSLLIELPVSGGLHPSHRISTTHLYKYVSTLDRVLLAVELVFVGLTLLRTRKQIVRVLRLWKAYLHDGWNLLEFTLCVLSLAYISCLVFRHFLVAQTVEDLRATYLSHYVTISWVVFWDMLLRLLSGMMVFIAVIQVLKLLRHRQPFQRIGGVLQHAAGQLAVIGLMLLLWLAAFSCLGLALYGAVSPHFHALDAAVLSVSALLTRRYHFPELDEGTPTGVLSWRVFTIAVLVLALGSLAGLVRAVLIYNFRRYRPRAGLVLSLREAVAFYWRSLRRALAPPRPQRPPDNVQNVPQLPMEFTMAEIEYQVDEMLFKMNALTGGSNLPDKPPMYFTDSDCTYGLGEGDAISSGSEMAALEKERLEQRVHKIEDNLYGQQPQLAQLIQLNAIGVDLLGQEKEKHLRAQLELEIFRQLQQQRQESGPAADPLPPALAGLSIAGLAAGGLSAGGLSTGGLSESPAGGAKQYSLSMPLGRLGQKLTFPKPPNLGALFPAMEGMSEDPLEDDPDHTYQAKDYLERSASLDHSTSDATTDAAEALAMSDQTANTATGQDQAIPMQHMDSKTKEGKEFAGPLPPKQGNASSSSSSSGGAEIRALFHRHDDILPEPFPIPFHAESELDPEVKSKPVDKAKAGDVKSKVKSLEHGARPKVVPDLSVKTKSGGDSIFAYDHMLSYDSSNSEPDSSSKSSSKARSLRKTKSRGKGKGFRGGQLNPIDLQGLDEFSFDNHGYSSDSDNGKQSGRRYIPGVTHKECWS